MEISLQSVFGMIIGGGLALIIIVFFIVPIIKSQLPKEIDEATRFGFDKIIETINRIKSKEISEKTVIIDVNEPFVIVGFSDNEYVKPSYSPDLGTWVLGTSVKKLGSPCLGKTCLCICLASSESIAHYGLEGNDCFKYKKECVNFDDIINLKGSDEMAGEFVLRPFEEAYKISLKGIEDGIMVDILE